MNIHIRQYRSEDAAQVQEICAPAKGTGLLSRAVRNATLQVFCDYYLEYEAEHCFAAVDEDGAIVGYVLCATDFESFGRKLRGDFLPKKGNLVAKAMGKGTVAAMRPYAKAHPAHLHIDIHPDYQRMGVGTALLNHLTAYLRDQSIDTVMLNVAADNAGAMRFYKKYGFYELGRSRHEIAMAVSTRRNER